MDEITYPIRINRYLYLKGYCSRRQADGFIERGLVKVNGKKAVMGQKIESEKDKVEVSKEVENLKKSFEYYIFNKPLGIVSHNPQGSEKEVTDVFKTKEKVFPVGRLDKDSEGLMLLSNDGEWLNNINHPSKGYEKEYIVTVSQPIDLNSFKKVVTDKKEKLVINKLSKLNKFEYKVTLNTGKNREIRRVFAKNNVEIRNLKRISIGNFSIEDMKIGQLSQINSN